MHAGRPAAYQRIVEDLTARIRDGEYPPGTRLPTEAQMVSAYGVSCGTVRAAVRILGTLGLVETRHGIGSFVVERRRLSVPAIGGAAGDGVAWSSAVRAAGSVPSERASCQIVQAGEGQAALLGVEAGSPLVLHRSWRSIDGLPAVIESAYYPRWVVNAVPALGAPLNGLDTEVHALLSASGHPLARHADRLTARPPTPEEIGFFATPAGGSLLVLTRISRSKVNAPAIRILDTVYHADLHELVYDPVRCVGAG